MAEQEQNGLDPVLQQRQMIREILNEFVTRIAFRLREPAGEFPSEIRVDVLFGRADGLAIVINVHNKWSDEDLARAEAGYQDWVKAETLRIAREILTRGESEL